MAKKVIRLTESELRNIIERETRLMLMEMPYNRRDYVPVVDTNARNAYIHIAKLIAYGNSTNDANGWINEIINKFTIPMLSAKVRVSDRAKNKVIENGYINNFFGNQYEDYETQFRVMIIAAIDKVEEEARRRNLPIPQHNDINLCIENGKSMVMAYGNIIKTLLLNGSSIEIMYESLQQVLRYELITYLNL